MRWLLWDDATAPACPLRPGRCHPPTPIKWTTALCAAHTPPCRLRTHQFQREGPSDALPSCCCGGTRASIGLEQQPALGKLRIAAVIRRLAAHHDECGAPLRLSTPFPCAGGPPPPANPARVPWVGCRFRRWLSLRSALEGSASGGGRRAMQSLAISCVALAPRWSRDPSPSPLATQLSWKPWRPQQRRRVLAWARQRPRHARAGPSAARWPHGGSALLTRHAAVRPCSPTLQR